jgi:hypothetical protein
LKEDPAVAMFSTGLKSGEYGGKNSTFTYCTSINAVFASPLGREVVHHHHIVRCKRRQRHSFYKGSNIQSIGASVKDRRSTGAC